MLKKKKDSPKISFSTKETTSKRKEIFSEKILFLFILTMRHSDISVK